MADPMPSLRTVLVTGGGSGIGAALAVGLAGRGCDVIISGRRSATLDAVAASAEQVTACVGDITDASHRAGLVETLAAAPGPRGVFHGAGFFQVGPLGSLSAAEWHDSFDTNVTARWQLSTDCAPLLDDGRLLFIGSDAGANPRPGGAAYSVAQAASETLRRSLQAEWAGTGRAVGGFKPGLVDTEMVRGFMALPVEEFPARPAYEDYVDRGRLATPELVARFAAWLLLDVDTPRFVETEWDIRDESHHHEWTDMPLYPNAR
ncbi:MAG: SDR family NAD(P)-dependent oxidoreductase [Ilumatobacter sp.]